jgi:hypothetical protein
MINLSYCFTIRSIFPQCKLSVEKELLIPDRVSWECTTLPPRPLNKIPLPCLIVVLRSQGQVYVSIKVGKWQLEYLVAPKCNNFLHIGGYFEVLFIPLVEVYVTLSNYINLLKGQVIDVVWLWWVKYIPEFYILEVQVVVCDQGYHWNEDLPGFSLKKCEDKLCPHSHDINESGQSVET